MRTGRRTSRLRDAALAAPSLVAMLALAACSNSARDSLAGAPGANPGTANGGSPPPADAGANMPPTTEPGEVNTQPPYTGNGTPPPDTLPGLSQPGGGTAGSLGAAGSVGSIGMPGTAGSWGGGDASADAGADAGPPAGCTIKLTRQLSSSSDPGLLVSTEDFTNPALEAKANATLIVRATVTGYAGTPTWDWKLKIQSNGREPDYVALDDSRSLIEIQLAYAGNYTIQPILVDGPPQCVYAPYSVYVAARDPAYVFRVTPPSSSRLPAREKLIDAASISVATDEFPIDLGAATAANVVSLAPVDMGNFPMPSYVRVTSASLGFSIEAYTGQGPLVATLDPGLTYDVLVVPNGPAAPLFVSGSPASFRDPRKLAISPGTIVTGVARDGEGAPVADARVVLRDGSRPSTVGISDVGGAFALSTREGAVSATISPPPGSGLPEAYVAATSGIVIPPGTAGLDLSMAWARAPSAPLTVTVRAKVGGAPLPGARVHVENADALSSVGTLEVSVPGQPTRAFAATGSARGDAVADATGVAHLGRLPLGSYRLTAAPPEGLSAAVTSVRLDLPAGGLARDVVLGSLVMLTGTLQASDSPQVWSITALDRGVLAAPIVPHATVGLDGSYALMISPSRSYQMVVEITTAQRTRRTVFGSVTPGNTDMPTWSSVVPAGMNWAGRITSAGRPVVGATVRAFCENVSPCDPSIAVAEGVSAADGTITLSLPMPPAKTH
jgi:hypothetical protein